MIMKSIFNKTSVPLMQKVLDIAGTRQRIIAGNIANASTQGYQKQEVDFKASLEKENASQSFGGLTNHERHIPIYGNKNNRQTAVIYHKDQNTDIEQEMAVSAENQLIYQTAANLVSRQFRGLKGAIRGRF